MVLTAKYIAKYRSGKSKTTIKENVHSRVSNSTMDDYHNHKKRIDFLSMVKSLPKQLLYSHTTFTNQLNLT